MKLKVDDPSLLETVEAVRRHCERVDHLYEAAGIVTTIIRSIGVDVRMLSELVFLNRVHSHLLDEMKAEVEAARYLNLIL
jgi:hypothetical protein